MLTLGIIDDRNDKRTSFARKINLEIKKFDTSWNILDIEPFINKDDYLSWISENNIAALIIDERLYEEETGCGNNINYSGHELVEFLRGKFKDLPLYIVTNVTISEELKKTYKQFNLILSNSEFDEKIKDYLNLIIMSGHRFFNDYQNELERLSELSAKMVKGKANDNDIKEAKALQTKLSIPHYADQITDREQWIEEVSGLKDKLEQLSSEIHTYLKEE